MTLLSVRISLPVGGFQAILGLPTYTMFVGEYTGGHGCSIVATPSDKHDTKLRELAVGSHVQRNICRSDLWKNKIVERINENIKRTEIVSLAIFHQLQSSSTSIICNVMWMIRVVMANARAFIGEPVLKNSQHSIYRYAFKCTKEFVWIFEDSN